MKHLEKSKRKFQRDFSQLYSTQKFTPYKLLEDKLDFMIASVEIYQENLRDSSINRRMNKESLRKKITECDSFDILILGKILQDHFQKVKLKKYSLLVIHDKLILKEF